MRDASEMIRTRRDESGEVLELSLARPPANALNTELLGLIERQVREAADGDAEAVRSPETQRTLEAVAARLTGSGRQVDKRDEGRAI